MSSFAWFVGIGALVIAGVILVATLVKVREVRRAKRWPSVRGKITASKVESRERGGVHKDDAERVANYPLVVYQFDIGGRHYTGKRVTIGEAMPNVDVESTLARYPLGATVEVFYDPTDPRQCVLERDFPPHFAKVIGCLVAFVIVGAAVLVLGGTELASKLGEHMHEPTEAALALLVAGMGLFTALIAFATHRQCAATKTWPCVRGRVKESHVERYLSTGSSGNRRRSILFRPHVVYAYTVDGREYASDRIALGMLAGSSVASMLRSRSRGEDPRGEIEIVDRTGGVRGSGVPTKAVEDVVRRYSPGTEVDVYYDPANHGEALLERRAAGVWLLWVVAAAFFAGAIAILAKQ
jgi:hypothetical protein